MENKKDLLKVGSYKPEFNDVLGLNIDNISEIP